MINTGKRTSNMNNTIVIGNPSKSHTQNRLGKVLEDLATFNLVFEA